MAHDDDPTWGLHLPVTLNDLAVAVLKIGGAQISHDRVCAQQWRANNARLRRIEALVMGTCGAVITALCGAVWYFITHGALK